MCISYIWGSQRHKKNSFLAIIIIMFQFGELVPLLCLMIDMLCVFCAFTMTFWFLNTTVVDNNNGSECKTEKLKPWSLSLPGWSALPMFMIMIKLILCMELQNYIFWHILYSWNTGRWIFWQTGENHTPPATRQVTSKDNLCTWILHLKLWYNEWRCRICNKAGQCLNVCSPSSSEHM